MAPHPLEVLLTGRKGSIAVIQQALPADVRSILALDDLLNDELSASVSVRSFMK